MPYIIEVVKAGNTIEVSKYYSSRFNKKGVKRGKDDMSAYAAKKTQIAAAVANAIAVQFGLKKGSQEAGSSPATAPATQEIKAGSVVTIKSGAVYGGLSSTRGKAVPAAQLGGKRHTVDKVQTNKGVQEAKLKGINSWVAVASLTAV